ncbi:MAG: hypothetical protein AAB499_02095, partial [Patescibacteria group bacterium]
MRQGFVVDDSAAIEQRGFELHKGKVLGQESGSWTIDNYRQLPADQKTEYDALGRKQLLQAGQRQSQYLISDGLLMKAGLDIYPGFSKAMGEGTIIERLDAVGLVVLTRLDKEFRLIGNLYLAGEWWKVANGDIKNSP